MFKIFVLLVVGGQYVPLEVGEHVYESMTRCNEAGAYVYKEIRPMLLQEGIDLVWYCEAVLDKTKV